MPHAYGYARVSSYQQRDEGVSLEDQQEKLPKLAASRYPHHEYAGTFSDAASASVLPFTNRRMGKKISQEVMAGDAILVIRGDRIFRSLHDHVCMSRLFKQKGVALYLDDLGMDLTSPSGELVANLKASVAQYESQILGTRTREAHWYLMNKGIWWMPVPIGWYRTSERRLVPDLGYRAEIERLHRMQTINGWTRNKLLLWARREKLRTRDGKEWDMRRLRRAFNALRDGWPTTATDVKNKNDWVMGPEGFVVPPNHPSLAEPLASE